MKEAKPLKLKQVKFKYTSPKKEVPIVIKTRKSEKSIFPKIKFSKI